MAGELEKTPTADSSVSKPSSGAYGEKAVVEKLRSQLPASSAGGAPQGAPPPGGMPMPTPGGMPGQRGRPTQAPGLAPSALMHPTQRPGVPLGQPMAQAPVSPMQDVGSESEARMVLLQALSSDPTVSEVTRQWAASVLKTLHAR